MKNQLQLTNIHRASVFTGLVCLSFLGIMGAVKGQIGQPPGPNKFNQPSINIVLKL